MASPTCDVDGLRTADEPMCAVCLDAVSPNTKAVMPCCDRLGASTDLCSPCMRFICERGIGGVGRCPKCRAHVRPVRSVDDESATSTSTTTDTGTDTNNNQFELASMRGTCLLCQQIKDVVDERSVCDACVYGNRFSLRFECFGCGGVQQIPHPMWRYQVDGPEQFGNTPWACHMRCRTYTKWRVVAEDISSVPPEDAPESWGTTDAWLTRVREQRRVEETRSRARVGGNAGRGGGVGDSESQFTNAFGAVARWLVSLFSPRHHR